jgi:hypothetical protein
MFVTEQILILTDPLVAFTYLVYFIGFQYLQEYYKNRISYIFGNSLLVQPKHFSTVLNMIRLRWFSQECNKPR